MKKNNKKTGKVDLLSRLSKTRPCTASNGKKRPPTLARVNDNSTMKKGKRVQLDTVQAEVSVELKEVLGGTVEQPTPIPNTLMTTTPTNELDTQQGRLTPERAREIRKLRTTFGKRLPSLSCDNCAYSQQCPYFKPGYECAFGEVVKGIKLETEEDLQQAMLRIAEANMTTAELGLIHQRLAGGVIDDKTSNRLDSAFEQLATIARIKAGGQQGNPNIGESISGPGIIEKLFGGLARVMEAAKEGEPRKEVIIDRPASSPVEILPDEKVAEILKTEKEVALDEVLGEFQKDV